MKRASLILTTVLVAGCILLAGNAFALTWPENCHEYEILLLPNASWESALQDVQSRLGAGWYLATITSQAENDFIYDNLVAPTVLTDPDQPRPGNVEWWLGAIQFTGNDADQTKNWRWITGENWNYTHWNGGEPSGGEYFLGMWGPDSGPYSGVGGFWNDEGLLENIKGYIAEKGLNAKCKH